MTTIQRLIFVLTWILFAFQSTGYAYDGHFTLAAETMVTNGPAGGMGPLASRLTGRQSSLLSSLAEQNSSVLLPKRGVSMADLRALTIQTGDEFAMFTRGGQRWALRGEGGSLPALHVDNASMFNGWRFSGHTHTPGFQAVGSPGDAAFLRAINQRWSGVWGASGETGMAFGTMGDRLNFNFKF